MKKSHHSLNERRDKLDQDNAEETKRIRKEISKIKQEYIKKHGIPKDSDIPFLRGIAPSDPPDNTHS